MLEPVARRIARSHGPPDGWHEREEPLGCADDEDRCRARSAHLPRNLACLTNLAITIVRLKGRFEYLPQAHRHYARRPHDAVRELLEPPKR